MTGTLNYISARAAFALSQLPTTTAFAITSNNGNNFGTSNSTVTISGSAPIRVKEIQINGVPYGLVWTSPTTWTLSIPLNSGTNLLAFQGVDNFGTRLTNALDSITVTNTGASAFARVVVNEWVADNAGPRGFADPADGLFQDWFELFNPNTSDITLSGYYLTDNPTQQPAKWRIPTNTVITARGFLLVWADNNTNQNTGVVGSHLHAAFQLSAGGEALGLFAPDGVTPQSIVHFGSQGENISEGWYPDGATNNLVSMRRPTPKAPNLYIGDPRFTSITLEAGLLSFTWESFPGQTYRLEYTTDLSTGIWEFDGPPVTASNNPTSTTRVVPIDTARFYRVAEVDPD
jgi:hypothetical protein